MRADTFCFERILDVKLFIGFLFDYFEKNVFDVSVLAVLLLLMKTLFERNPKENQESIQTIPWHLCALMINVYLSNKSAFV